MRSMAIDRSDENGLSVAHVFAIPRLEGGCAMQLRVKFALAAAPLIIAALMILLAAGSACAASITIVALGASNTYGRGVARSQAYPAQLEAMLQASGSQVRVVSAGVNG